MQTEETENVLVIRETPGCLWFVGLFFSMIGGVFVYGALGGFTNYKDYSPWVIGLTFLMGAAAVGVGIWIFYRAPITRVVIDRIENTVLMTRYGLFGKQQTFYDFDEIERFCLIEEKDDEGDNVWSLGMKLTSDETIKISSLASHDERFKSNFVFEINEFMHKQMPLAQMILELEGENDQ
ncbi:MAG: hypothetical protein ABJA66_14605 [Actinomycetota bacterium]